MVIGSLDGGGLQVSVRPLGHFCESPEPCFQSQGDRIRTSISQREQCCLSRGDAAEFLQSVPGADVLVCSPCLVGRISLLGPLYCVGGFWCLCAPFVDGYHLSRCPH